MTTSGTTNTLLSVEEIITQAYREMGVLSAEQAPSANELSNGIRVLNWMLKGFTARGINLWRAETITLTVTAVSTVLDASIDNVQEVYRTTVSGQDIPMFPLTRAQYAMLPNKTSIGIPNQYWVDRQRDACVLYVWPVSTAQTLKIYAARRIDDVTAADQTIDVPQKWTEAVFVALAARLIPTSGLRRTDPATAATIEKRAAAGEQLLLDDDRPESVFMGAGYGGTR